MRRIRSDGPRRRRRPAPGAGPRPGRRSAIALAAVAIVAAAVAGGLLAADRPAGHDDGAAGALTDAVPSSAAPRSAAPPPADPAARRPGVARWTVVPSTVRAFGRPGGALGDVTVHRPAAGLDGPARGRLPVVLLLGRQGTDPAQYGQLAHDVASYGPLVLVPVEATGERAISAARRWATRSARADPGRLAVLALDRPSALAAGRAPGVDAVAVQLADDEPALPATRRPTFVLGREPREQRGRHVVLVHDADADPLALTDEGRRGPPRGLAASPAQAERIEVHARRFGTWFAALGGDAPSRRFVEDAVAAAEAAVVGSLPW